MSYSTKPFETSSHTDGASSQGFWLLLARVAWCVVTATVLVIYVGGMPARIARVLDPRLLEPLDLGGLTINFSLTYIVAVELLVVLIFVAVASIIFWHKSSHGAAILVALLLLSYGPGEVDFASELVKANSAWRWPVDTLRALGEVLSVVVFYIFPNGRFVPRWTRYVAFVYSGVVLVWLLNKDLPFNVLYGPVHPLTLLIALSIHSTGVFALAYRYRHQATHVEKQQMKWAVFGLIIAFLFSVFRYSFDAILRVSGHRYEVFWYILYNMIVEPISWLGLIAAPVCICVALLRRRLWDIDPIINRTLVYGSLTAAIMSIYAAVVGMFSALLSVNSTILLTLIGTGLIAVLVQPLRDFLQHAVNRLMYGERDDPYVVLARLGERLESTLAPNAMLQAIVSTIKDSLKLPYVAIALVEQGVNRTQYVPALVSNRPQQAEVINITDIDHLLSSGYEVEIVAVVGIPQANSTQLRLIYRGELVGLILLAPRASGERFSPKDERLLSDLARQVAIAIHALRVTIDLQRAREQLVTDIEEERCRIRDDLHDSFLSRITKTIRDIEEGIDQLRCAPDQSETLLRRAVEVAVDASALARSLIYKIRPPVLDLGLGYALADLAEQSQHPDLRIYVDVPSQLPPLHPAVEDAAYRIVQAALSNVEQHAQAHICQIHLSLGDMLNLEIIDDGCGIQSGVKPGIGLNTMRKRAEQLSGSCIIEPTPKGGTCIRVRLPVLLKNKRDNSDTVTDEEIRRASR